MSKHLTKAELEARQKAEAQLKRTKRTYLKPPKWLSKEAWQIFQDTKKRLKGLDLLEPADIDLLANYADAQARYQKGVKHLNLASDTKEVQAVQAWSRIALAYADKLGFSQTARARLARRRAQEEPLDEMEEVLSGAKDLLRNGEGG